MSSSSIENQKRLERRALLKKLQKTTKPSKKWEEDALTFVRRDQALPLSWSQQSLWFIAQLDVQASRAYHIPASLRLSGTLNLAVLERTLNTLLERHEVLRTSFAQNKAGEPIQVLSLIHI